MLPRDAVRSLLMGTTVSSSHGANHFFSLRTYVMPEDCRWSLAFFSGRINSDSEFCPTANPTPPNHPHT